MLCVGIMLLQISFGAGTITHEAASWPSLFVELAGRRMHTCGSASRIAFAIPTQEITFTATAYAKAHGAADTRWQGCQMATTIATVNTCRNA